MIGPAPWSSLWAWLLLAAGAPDVEPEILERARAGEHRAFAQIVSHYDHRLRGLAYRLLGDRDRMDDALQEAYLKAFRGLPAFRSDSSLGTWLYRIAYNACMDELRRGPKVVALFSSGDADAGPGSSGGGESRGGLADGFDHEDSAPDVAEATVERAQLAAALNDLPVDQRTAVMLVDAYGLDYAETAAVLGVRTGTIASRLNRARTVLRAAMTEETA